MKKDRTYHGCLSGDRRIFLGSQSAILVQNSHIDTKGTPDTDSAHNTELTGDTGQTSSPSGNLSIVIDAGHGGIDPGKVGTNDALERTSILRWH